MRVLVIGKSPGRADESANIADMKRPPAPGHFALPACNGR